MVFGVLESKQSPGDADLIDDLKQRNETLVFQVKCAKDELTSRDSKMQALDRKVRRLEERLEHAETERRCSDELVDELQESKILLECEMTQLKIDFDERISDIEAMEQGLDQLEQEKAVAKGVSSELMVGLKEKNEALEKNLEELESSKAEASKDLVYLEEDLRHAEQQLDDAELKTREVHRQMADLDRENKKAVTQIHELEQKNQALEQQTSELKMGAMELSQQLAVLQEEKQATDRQLAGDNNHNNKAHKDTMASLATTKEKLREMEQRNVVLSNELADHKQQQEETMRTHASSLKTKQDQLTTADNSHQSLQTELESTKEDLGQHIQKVKELEEKCIALAQSSEGTGDAKDEIMAHLQQKNQELQGMLKDRDAQKGIWESEILCLKRRVLELEDELVSIHALEQRNETLSNTLKRTQEDREDQKSRILKLTNNCEQLEKEVVAIHSLEQRNESLSNTLKRTQEDREDQKSRILKLTNNCEQLEKEVDKLNAAHRRIEELEQRLLSQEDGPPNASANDTCDPQKAPKAESDSSSFSSNPPPPYPIERVSTGYSTGSNSERVDQKWQKYALSVEKLSSRNDKLQIDLEDTRHRISLVSKDISKRMQRGQNSPYFSKIMHSLKKLSYRNDQLQIDLNEARGKVMSLHDEQTRTNHNDAASQESSSLLVERSQVLHQLATRHKDLHLELVKSRNHVIHLQKELKAGKFGEGSGPQRLNQNNHSNNNSVPPPGARQRQILSHVPQHIVASNGRNDEVSTIMDSCADISKCSI